MSKRDVDLKQWYETEVKDLKNDPEFIAQGIMMDLAIEIADFLKENGLKQKELAKRLGKSQGWVSRFLNAPTNFSVLKLAEIAVALEIPLHVSFKAKREEIISVNPKIVPGAPIRSDQFAAKGNKLPKDGSSEQENNFTYKLGA